MNAAHGGDEPEPGAGGELLATTPSLGVRLMFDGGQVCLQVANEGGRGAPEALLLLPVHRRPDGGLQPVHDLPALAAAAGTAEGAAAWSAFLQLHRRRLPATLAAPATERFSPAQWRQISQGRAQVLALVLFRRRLAARQASPAAAAAALARAVAGFFDSPPSAAWLRRGLVQLAAADLPSDDNGAPPQPVCFVLASCRYPAGLVDGSPADWTPGGRPGGPADAAMLRLAARLQQPGAPGRPSLLLLTGDQIYTDPAAGLYNPRGARLPALQDRPRESDDWLRLPYLHWLANLGSQAVLGLLPSRMVLDDHEIEDNWAPLPAAAGEDARRQARRARAAGRAAYLRFQRCLPAGTLPGVLWQAQPHRGIGFFMADTRTERSPRTAAANPLHARIMSRRQALALSSWLALQPARPAFVVTPAMLLPRRRSSARHLAAALQSDAWCGHPGSLHLLLARLWRLGRQNLVFLSGDEHLSCIVEATVTDAARTRSVRLLSVHSSALYAPYPFANSKPADFALPDDWDFHDPQQPAARYHCSVRLCGAWAPGDGFAVIGLRPPDPAAGPGGDWQLQVLFDRAPGSAAGGPQVFALPSGAAGQAVQGA